MPPTVPPAMAPTFELLLVDPGLETGFEASDDEASDDEEVEDVVVAVATWSWRREESVASANPPKGVVTVAPPVALCKGEISDQPSGFY
jgi:hypothetical protein